VFSTAGVVIVGGLALVTLARAFLAAKLERDARRELESGPPRHMFESSSLGGGGGGGGGHDPWGLAGSDSAHARADAILLSGGSLAATVGGSGGLGGGDGSSASLGAEGDGSSAGSGAMTNTERFLNTMRFQDGGRKHIERLVGGRTGGDGSDDDTSVGGNGGDGGKINSGGGIGGDGGPRPKRFDGGLGFDPSRPKGGGGGSGNGLDDLGDDDRAISLWARDVDQFKVRAFLKVKDKRHKKGAEVQGEGSEGKQRKRRMRADERWRRRRALIVRGPVPAQPAFIRPVPAAFVRTST
jgi:hypothetical protein